MSDVISINVLLPVELLGDDPEHLGCEVRGPVTLSVHVLVDKVSYPERELPYKQGATLASAMSALHLALQQLTERADAEGLIIRTRVAEREEDVEALATQPKGDA